MLLTGNEECNKAYEQLYYIFLNRFKYIQDCYHNNKSFPAIDAYYGATIYLQIVKRVEYLGLDEIKDIIRSLSSSVNVNSILSVLSDKEIISYLYETVFEYVKRNGITITEDTTGEYALKNGYFKLEQESKYDIPKIKEEVSNRRDPRVVENSVIFSSYLCEFDSRHRIFTSKTTGCNYVEGHHFIPLEFESDFKPYSLDIEANVISLCPSCHKLLHFGVFDARKKTIIDKLYEQRIERLKKCEIYVSTEKLYEYYKI